MANKDSSQALKCSFCGKSQKQVIKLIAGPGVYICDECIELCVEIIEEEKVENNAFKEKIISINSIVISNLDN